MSDDDDVLLGTAGKVADGAPVDWENTTRSHRSLDRPLGRLRLMERVAVVHRALREGTDLPAAGLREAGTATLDSGREPASRDPAPHPARWGPLRVLDRIGSGGYADVYRARDPALGRDVALKLGHAGATADVSRFLDEARRLASLRHPNVLVVHGADRHDGRAGLWSDLVEGRTLEECLAEQGPFSADEAALVGVEVCRALAAVHGAGLIHRDVKTTNIMRERGGRIVLMDFGAVSQRLPSGPGSATEPVAGTPLFMAPELFAGGRASVASDLYALGVVLYRLVTGRYPVEADSLEALRARHAGRESTALHDVRPDLPAAFVQAVSRALAARPDDRPATAGEMERALAGTLGAATAADTAAASGVGSRPPFRVGRVAALAAVVALVAAGAVAFRGLFAPPAFRVDAALYSLGDGSEARLEEGDRIVSGDRLFLEIRGSRPMHVYVLDEDEAGSAFVLFPLAGLDQGNPLPSGRRHRLPGRAHGEARYWSMSSVGGEETVSVIAAVEPLADLERAIARLPRAGDGTPAPISAPALEESLRGLGRLVGDEGQPAPARPLAGVLGRVATHAADTSGVWITQVRLRSAAP